MPLALFDLDKTLIDGDSEELWIEYLIDVGELDEDVRAEVQRFGDAYLAGNMDFNAWQRFMLRPQAALDPSRLEVLRQACTAELLQPIIRPWMLERVQWHREQGHRPVVITATNRWIVEPVVQALGIGDLIATEPQVSDDRFTGEVEGEPCFQAGKIHQLQVWMNRETAVTDRDRAGPHWAYSDSFNDLALLEFADHPVAVTPDARLAELAAARGWEVLNS